jgi:uncharacterized membrane protein
MLSLAGGVGDLQELAAGRAGGARRQVRHGDLPGLDGAFLRGSVRGPGAAVPPGAVLGAAGGALAAYGLYRGGRVGRTMRHVGTGLMAKGLHDVRRPETPTERRRAFDIQQSLEIAAPPGAVFAFWRDVRNLPRAFAHVREVRDLGGGRSAWRVDGADGRALEWTAEVVELVPERLLVWRSEPGSLVDQSGVVRIEPSGAGTRLALRLCYRPPAGRAGRVIGSLLGEDPKAQIGEDLGRLKLLLETGSPTEERQGDVV